MIKLKELYVFVSKGNKEPFYSSRYALRYISCLFSWICIRANIRSNVVTLISLVLALFGAYLQVYNDYGILAISVVCLTLYNVLDHTDGELARYEKLKLNMKKGPEGPFLDTIVHYLFTPIFFFALGYNMYINTGWVLGLWLGISSSIWLSSYGQAASLRVLMDALIIENRPISYVKEIWQHDKVVPSDIITFKQVIRKVIREVFSTQGQILLISMATLVDYLYPMVFQARWMVLVFFGLFSLIGIPRSIYVFFRQLKSLN